MKKALVVLLALTCLGAAAFADGAAPAIKISGSLETGFAAVMPNFGQNVLKLYDNDSGNAARLLLGIAFTSADGNWGLITRLDAEGLYGNGGAAAGKSGYLAFGPDRAVLWGNLLGGMVTLKGGILDEEAFATAWEGWGNFLDGNTGFEVQVKPISGLLVSYVLPVNGSADMGSLAPLVPATPPALVTLQPTWAGNGSVDYALNHSVVAASYAMPNLANVIVGLQLSGSAGNGAYFWGGIDAKAVPNATIRLEWQASNIGAPSGIPAYSVFEELGYTLGAIGLDLAMYQDISTVSGANVMYDFRPSVTYNLGMATVGVGLDYGTDNGYNWGFLGLPKRSTATSTASNFDLYPWVSIPFGGNQLNIGATYAIADLSNGSVGGNTSMGFFVDYRVFF